MLTDNDLKSYIKSYYLDRKMTYTKLDKHDRAIGVLLEENKQLKEENNKVRKLVKNYEELEKMLGAGQPRFPLYKLQEILGGKENE